MVWTVKEECLWREQQTKYRYTRSEQQGVLGGESEPAYGRKN